MIIAWVALAYLVWRTAAGFFHRATSPREVVNQGAVAVHAKLVSNVMLIVLGVIMLGVRILPLQPVAMTDIGYASVAGARLELASTAPWGNMPPDVASGDTYGPINYLLYIPAVELTESADDSGWRSAVRPARMTALFGDMASLSILALIAYFRWGLRPSLLVSLAWLSCPWTLLALGASSNDSLVSLVVLATIASMHIPALRGLIIGIGVGIKFVPGVLLFPLAFRGKGTRGSSFFGMMLSLSFACAASLAWIMYRGVSVNRFIERTLIYQARRTSDFSMWSYLDLPAIRVILSVSVVCLFVAMALRSQDRSWKQSVAGIVACLIAVQLIASYWFFMYIAWFVGPLVLYFAAIRFEPLEAINNRAEDIDHGSFPRIPVKVNSVSAESALE